MCRVLQERVGADGSWTAVTGIAATATSHGVTGKADGTYSYRLVIGTGTTAVVVAGPASVTVAPPPAVVTASVSWDPETVDHGGASTLSWSSTAATSCELDGSSAALSGSREETNLTADRTSTLTCTGDGDETASASATVTVRPPAPEAPTGPAMSAGAHTVSWGAVTGATHYAVQARRDDGNWSAPGQVTARSKRFTGVAAGIWDYRVQACNAGGCGAWSASKTVVVGTGLTIAPSPSPDGDYTVSWQGLRCTLNFGQGLSCRELQERVGRSGAWTTLSGIANQATSHGVTGKTPGNYYYRLVRGEGNALQLAAGPAVVTVPEPASGTPARPARPTGPADSTGAHTVSWGAVTGATHYKLHTRLNAGAWGTAERLTGTSRTFTRPPGDWDYQVRACNNTACSAWSETLTVVVTDDSRMSVSPAPSPDGDYTVSWQGARCALDFGQGLSCRELQARVGDDGSWTTVSGIPNQATSHGVTGKAHGTYYYRLVRGEGDALQVVAGPVRVTVAEDDDEEPEPELAASISWDPETVDYGGSSTLSWSSTEATSCELDGSSTTLSGSSEKTNLTETRTSTLTCTGEDDETASASATVTVTATAPAMPAPEVAVGDTTATVSWTAPAANGSAITGYTLRYKRTSETDWTSHSLGATETSRELQDLTNDVVYEVQVEATNGVGSSGWSTPSTRFTPTASEPDLAASISWDPDTVDYGGSSTLSWSATAATGCELDGSSTTLSGSREETNLTADRTSTLVCTGADDATVTATATLTVAPTVPDAPAPPEVAVGDTTATVSWTAPAANGSAITGYTLRYKRTSETDWTSHSLGATETSRELQDLTNDVVYEVQVEATNGVGSSGWRHTVHAVHADGVRVAGPHPGSLAGDERRTATTR